MSKYLKRTQAATITITTPLQDVIGGIYQYEKTDRYTGKVTTFFKACAGGLHFVVSRTPQDTVEDLPEMIAYANQRFAQFRNRERSIAIYQEIGNVVIE